MTKDITFIFRQEPSSFNLRVLEALHGTTLVTLGNDASCDVSNAVTDIFKKLIKENAPKYEKVIPSLSRFSISLNQSNTGKNRLTIESIDGKTVINLNKVSDKTAALFLNAMPQIQEAEASAKEPAQPKTTQLPLEPGTVEAIAKPSKQIATPQSKTTDTFSEPMVVDPSKKEPTLEEQMSGTIASLMVNQFQDTLIQHSAKSEEFFGTYLMNRVFGKIESCHFNFETFDFTLNFAQQKDITLNKLPVGKSDQQLATLKPLHGATLSIAKQVKGNFNIEAGKLTFEPGCLKLNWTWSSAELLGIFESRITEGNVIMQIKYGIHTQGPVSAQDFVDIIECNLPK